VTVRRATEDDLPALGELWRTFLREVPPPEYEDVDPEQELGEIAEIVRDGVAFVADGQRGEPVGFALARRKNPRRGHLTDLYVSPDARRSGTATALVRAVAETLAADGVPHLTLDVQPGNANARAVYGGWGFRESMLELAAPVEGLLARLSRERSGRTFGSIHVQTDDLAGIERAVRQFVPRLPGGSRGSVVAPPRNGWIAVYDDVCERDPRQLRRLAHELGDRTGGVVLALGVEEGAVARFILFERGSVVDEYLSVQEYYGPLPPGDVIALAANPRVVARLTGADPAAVRAAAVHAASPAELPPAEEVLAGIAAAMGIEGAGHGWSDAPDLDGAVRIAR
jgi:ribosomal protein S18 acetylase RimI-like enzyme